MTMNKDELYGLAVRLPSGIMTDRALDPAVGVPIVLKCYNIVFEVWEKIPDSGKAPTN
jgi:hypothetical protein